MSYSEMKLTRSGIGWFTWVGLEVCITLFVEQATNVVRLSVTKYHTGRMLSVQVEYSSDQALYV